MQGMKGLDGDLKNGFGKFPRSRGRENWPQWYAFVRASAMAGGTWDYFKPDLEPNPEPVLAPKDGFHDIRLRLDKMKKNAGSEQELRCWTCVADNDVDDDPFIDDEGCNGCRDRRYRKLVMPEKVARDLYGRGSVTLKRQDDWPKWYAAIKQAAKWKGVWEHIDLDVEDDKLPARPHRVHPNLEPAINKLKELSAAERKRSEDDAEHFKAVEMVLLGDQKRRADFDAGKGYIVWAILSTVAEPLVVYLYEETDPRKMLLILKERIPPALPEGYEQLQARGNRRNRRNRRR
ncbi:uncharacterized protein APUU_60344S [Aspergillus puulaauensis]|uniref:Uncharacterized protein n=1 Tax=Aspergillus puulaauensis TaxID=1220207 RepID=A0A7R8AQD6_9EURO|nr:uncharacterized protein APUU_60344S [Aspergillus puulaauensis]BCS27296.1 hypothetical protein APUU_60344S [Aspergillus puulaauensis]